MDLEKNQRIAALFEIYGSLLSKKQRTYIEEYYLYDLSLAEIADNFNISRASVLDSLNKAIKKLETYESNLHLLDKNTVIKNLIDNNEISIDELKKELERIME